MLAKSHTPSATSAKVARPGDATLTVTKAARVLGVSDAHLYRLAKRGDLPFAVRLGTRVIVSRRLLTQWLLHQGPAPMGVDAAAGTA